MPLSACLQDGGIDSDELSKQEIALESIKDNDESNLMFSDDTSPTAVVVSWENGDPSTRSNTLEANVRNTTNEAVAIDLQLVARAPSGKTIKRSLGRRNLAALELQTVSVPIRELPVQSAGAATPLTISATYTKPSYKLEAREVVLDETAPSRSLEVFSTVRHVTFDEDFSAATTRTIGAQAEESQDKLDDLLSNKRQKGSKIRLFNQSARTVEQAEASATADTEEVGEYSFFDVPAAEGTPDPFADLGL